MSQFDFGDLESPLSGSQFINGNLEPWRDALYSLHSGNARPSYAVPGLMWLDTTSTPWVLKMFQGSDDVVFGNVDPATLVFTPSGVGTLPAGSVGTSNIIDGSVTNAKLANMSANTVKVRQSGAGAPLDLAMAASTFLARLATGNIVAASVAQVKTLLGLGTAADNSVETVRLHPPIVKNATANLLLAEGGSCVLKNNTTAYTWTVAPQATVAHPDGTIITLKNKGASGNVTIAQGAGVTLTFAGDGATGNRTLLPGGQATLHKDGTNSWTIVGVGIQ